MVTDIIVLIVGIIIFIAGLIIFQKLMASAGRNIEKAKERRKKLEMEGSEIKESPYIEKKFPFVMFVVKAILYVGAAVAIISVVDIFNKNVPIFIGLLLAVCGIIIICFGFEIQQLKLYKGMAGVYEPYRK